MKKFSILMFALVAILGVQSAKAWGGFGHGAITYITEQHLTPTAKAECRRYLNHTLPWHASWMDHWRAVPPYQKLDKLHSFTATADGDVNWDSGKGKAVNLVKKTIKKLENDKYKSLPDSVVRYNLLVLIHALPDIHCPVHVSFSKKEFPQYKYTIRKKGKKLKMHKFWDASPGFTREDWTYEKYAAEVDNLKRGAVKKIVKKGNIDYWTRDIVRQAHRIYDITTPNIDVAKMSDKKKKEVTDLADEQVLKAAYRLAYVLNDIFK